MTSIFIIIFITYIAMNIGYLVILALFGLKIKPYPETKFQFNYKILIPVFNEQDGIKNLLDSIQFQNYPINLIQIIVVADHCTDNTVKIAKQMGAEVVERENGERGKACSVSEIVNSIKATLEDESDVVLIFDGDNIVDSNFLCEINKCLVAGADIAQGNTGIFNRAETIFTRLNYVNFAVTNRFKELARSQAKLTCRLRGHGMAFRAKTVKKMSWTASTLVEDQEMTLNLILQGYRVEWVHRAHVDSIIPATTKAAAVQRKRWSGGKSSVTKRAIPQLFQYSKEKHSFVAFDLMIDYMMSSYAIQLGIVMLGFICSTILLGLFAWQTTVMAGLGLSYLLYYFVASVLEKVPFSSFICFFLSPVFILWRVWIFVSSLKGAKAWH